MRPMYEPREDSLMLLDSVELTLSGRVLEIGVGSGIILSNLIKKNPTLEGFGTDVDVQALVEIESRYGDLMIYLIQCDAASVFRESCFDCTVFNPPYLPGDWEEDKTIYQMRAKTSIVLLMLEDAIRVTRVARNIYFILSNQTNNERLFDIAKKAGEITEMCRRRMFFEELIVYRLTRKAV